MKLSIRFKSLFSLNCIRIAYLLNIQSKAFVFTYFKWMALQYPSEYCLWYYTYSHFDFSLLYIFSCMNSMWKKQTMNGEERNRSCFLFYFFIFTVPKKKEILKVREVLFFVTWKQFFSGKVFVIKLIPSKLSFKFDNF